MRVAAYQAPLLEVGSMEALSLIRKRVASCEVERVDILCCPEAILGGLADYSDDPLRFAISANHLNSVLAPLASDTVTTIIGFTELGRGGKLYNSAAVFQRGAVTGIYRKLYPAINQSVYQPGSETSVFQAGDLTFGIVICNDSNYPEPARRLAARGATALFVPSNNGLPPSKGGAELVELARNCDIAMATGNKMWVIRSDVAGQANGFVAHGSSGIVDPAGTVVQTSQQLSEDLIIAEIGPRTLAAGRRCS